MDNEVKVTILGTRGSVPVCGAEYDVYGGATTCVALRWGGQLVVLDAGTGIIDLPRVMEPEDDCFTVLLTHPHIDHMIGLPMCPALFRKDIRADIYGADRRGMGIEALFGRMMSPPLWPITAQMLCAKVQFLPLEHSLDLKGITVDVMEGRHPGGISLLRLSAAGKRVVFMTDFTIMEEDMEKLVDFARDCDLLLCDGQYSPEEWPAKAGFGHNTWQEAARFGARCGAKQVRIIHHDPGRTDEQLDVAGKAVKQIHPGCAFGKRGEEVIL